MLRHCTTGCLFLRDRKVKARIIEFSETRANHYRYYFERPYGTLSLLSEDIKENTQWLAFNLYTTKPILQYNSIIYELSVARTECVENGENYEFFVYFDAMPIAARKNRIVWDMTTHADSGYVRLLKIFGTAKRVDEISFQAAKTLSKNETSLAKVINEDLPATLLGEDEWKSPEIIFLLHEAMERGFMLETAKLLGRNMVLAIGSPYNVRQIAEILNRGAKEFEMNDFCCERLSDLLGLSLGEFFALISSL